MMCRMKYILMTSQPLKRRNAFILIVLTVFVTLYVLYRGTNVIIYDSKNLFEKELRVALYVEPNKRFILQRVIFGQSNTSLVNNESKFYQDTSAEQNVTTEKISHKECNYDASKMKLLENLRIIPLESKIRPVFSPETTNYEVEVEHDQLSVKIEARPSHCDVTLLYGPDYIKAVSVNITVGVGENRFKILIVKEQTRQNQPLLLNTYYLLIKRKKFHDVIDSLNSMKVCHIDQMCDLKIYPSIRCDPQESILHKTWKQLQDFMKSLPRCKSIKEEGQGKWYVPCRNCSDYRNSCMWSRATWLANNCQKRYLTRRKLTSCLKGKKIIFIGDSTNRGMMYYSAERLNGTLSRWDKTHGTNILSDVNHSNTYLVFAYYPQFWLPVNRRPMFDKTVYHLLDRIGHLHNDSRTAFVIGGVQWLSVNHLATLRNILHRTGLSGAKIIVKTIGSGFNQQVDNVHYLPLADQRKLLKHNEELKTFSWRHKMDVIDTLNITFARYQHFYAGKCGCHFHQVRQSKLNQGYYHVAGDINEQYTEFLINSLCDDNK